VLSLAVLSVGAWLPVRRVAAVLPGLLAAPLVAIGRMQLTGVPASAAGPSATAPGVAALQLAVVLYLAGVAWSGIRLVRECLAVRARIRTCRPVADAGWRRAMDTAAESVGLRRPVRLLAGPHVRTPQATGTWRPTVLLPLNALGWRGPDRHALLVHELSHLGAADPAFALVARAACVLLWFDPLAWWAVRQLHEASEHAADDRVLSAGVKASDYTSLLLRATDATHGRPEALAALLTGGRGIRGRIAEVVEHGRDRRRPTRRAMSLAAVAALALAAGLSVVRLTPSRGVLTALLADATWESRAYAVVGLAQRADTIALARAAAESDPSPHVRAWARYALAGGLAPASDPRSSAFPVATPTIH
jgi:beta-lactamase regulating signal transducer with metallopeptidase domain